MHRYFRIATRHISTKHRMADWNYLHNHFDNMTIGRFPLMVKLTYDHTSKLRAQQSDADIQALLLRTEPVHDAFLAAHRAFLNSKASRKGSTFRVSQLLRELSKKKIKQWDIQIQGVHLEGEPQYAILLPNRRSPFQQGAYDERIAQVKALAKRLEVEPALATTKDDVEAFHLQLVAARDTQQQYEGLMAHHSSMTNEARKRLAIMMFGNLGVLIDKYRENPKYAATFWETSLLKQHRKPKKDATPTV